MEKWRDPVLQNRVVSIFKARVMLCESKKAKPEYRVWLVKKSNRVIPKTEVLLWSGNWTFRFFPRLLKL